MLGKQMIRKAGIVFFGNVLSQGFALLFMLLATHMLSKEDYGYVSYIISMGSFFATVVAGGFPVAITRYISRDPSNEYKYIENGLFGNFLIFAIISVPVMFFFWPHMEIIVLILVSTLMMLYLGILRGKREFTLYSIVSSGRNIIKVCFLILLFYMGMVSKYSVVWIYVGAGIIILIGAELLSKNKHFVLPRYESRIFKTLLNFSIPLLLTTVFYSLNSTAGIAILNAELGDAAVATYKNALILLVIYGFVPGAIGIVLLPKISSSKEPKVILKSLRDSIIVSLAIEILIFIVAIFVGRQIIILFLGERYEEVYPLFLIMSFGMFFVSIRNMFSALWEGTGRPWISTLDMVVAGTITTLLSLFWIPIFGIYGAAYSYSVGLAMGAVTDFIVYIYGKHMGWFEEGKIHK